MKNILLIANILSVITLLYNNNSIDEIHPLNASTHVTRFQVGMNLESFQPEADGINQAIPSVNIAKSARSFESISSTFNNRQIRYDKNGYPLEVTSLDRVESHMLYELKKNSIPNGKYTILFDGEGEIAVKGLFKLIKKVNSNEYTIKISLSNKNYERGVLQIIRSQRGNHIRNIRIIMPGGICNDDIFHIRYKSNCKNIKLFVDMYKEDKNIFVFNPDYLRFVKDFSPLRVMNFHETSQKPPAKCNNCMEYKQKWNTRASVSSYSWGSSYRIDPLLRRGAPWEISIKLANILYKYNNNIKLYYVLPFNLTDNYIINLSKLINSSLNPNIHIFLEYNNEAWNPRFHGAQYVQYKGSKLNPEPDKNKYREGYKFYVTEAKRVFKIFNINFPRNRTNRVLGSFQWNPALTKGLLEYKDSYKEIDSIAIGTYFYMCYDSKKCKDNRGILALENSTQIEEYILSDKNRYGIPRLIKNIKLHRDQVNKYGIDLISYEGGLHITVQNLRHKYANHYVKILNRFSDSGHAYNLYVKYLNLLKSQDIIHTWVAFTSPQSYHKWGPFGIKQTLNGTGPKYQAVIEFTK
jgi:hypothetical protein